MNRGRVRRRYHGGMDPWWFVWLLIAYGCGSAPFGLLIGLSRGIDIRRHGSGNVGATNAGRVLGRRWGYLCFALDLLKGLVPVLVGGWALGYLANPALTAGAAWKWLGLAAAAVVGHMFPVWIGFKGGKGVATGLGAVLGCFPFLTVAGVAAALTWIVVVKATRYVSVASIAAALLLPVYMLAWVVGVGYGRDAWLPFLVVTAALGALVTLRHRGNLARLRAGTEPKIGASGTSGREHGAKLSP